MSEVPKSWDDVNQTSHLTWPDQIARIRADYDARIEALEAALRDKDAILAEVKEVLDWALICWDDHCEHGYTMQGDWVRDARATLAKIEAINA